MFLKSTRISPSHSRYFDMWRGASALVVVFAHCFQVFGSGFPAAYGRFFAALAAAAVMAFFALSGFFIHKSLARCYGSDLNWRSFLVARADRIIPPFAVSILLTVFLWFLAPYFFASSTREFVVPSSRAEYSLEGLWATIFFLNNFFGTTLSANGPLWSLTYEIWYYILACLFSMAMLGNRFCWIAAPLLVFLAAFDIWFAILGLVWVGGFYVSILHSNNILPRLPRIPFVILPMVLLLMVLLVSDSWAGKTRTLFKLVFGAWMVLHMISILSKDKVREIRLLVWAGSFSYSIYVLHFPIMLFFYGLSEQSGWLSLGFVIIVVALVGPALEKFKISKTFQKSD